MTNARGSGNAVDTKQLFFVLAHKGQHVSQLIFSKNCFAHGWNRVRTLRVEPVGDTCSKVSWAKYIYGRNIYICTVNSCDVIFTVSKTMKRDHWRSLANYKSKSSSSKKYLKSSIMDRMERLERIENLTNVVRAEQTKRFARRFKPALERLSSEEFIQLYRLTPHKFRILCELLDENLKSATCRGKPLSVIEQLEIALRYYASGTFQVVVADAMRVKQPTVSRVVTKVTSAILHLQNSHSMANSAQTTRPNRQVQRKVPHAKCSRMCRWNAHSANLSTSCSRRSVCK